jgi:hypothetical protein
MLVPANRIALRSDAMMADAVGAAPSRQEARSVVYRVAPAPRMALESSNLANGSKPAVGVANI